MRIWLKRQENLPAVLMNLCRQFVVGPEPYLGAPVMRLAYERQGESVYGLFFVLCHGRVDHGLNALLLIGRKGCDPVSVDRKGIGGY